MDSKQCLIQCPHCQPIHCPINTQGLYLLPATAYNTIDMDTYIDVDDYIERDNQARFAAAVTALAEQQCEPPEHTALLTQESERQIAPMRSNVSTRISQQWAIGNRFAALTNETDDEDDRFAIVAEVFDNESEQSEPAKDEMDHPRNKEVDSDAKPPEPPELLQSTRNNDDDEESVANSARSEQLTTTTNS
jgi:hypothetical protein